MCDIVSQWFNQRSVEPLSSSDVIERPLVQWVFVCKHREVRDCQHTLLSTEHQRCIHTHTHTHTQARTRTRTHTHTHTDTHRHTHRQTHKRKHGPWQKHAKELTMHWSTFSEWLSGVCMWVSMWVSEIVRDSMCVTVKMSVRESESNKRESERNTD